MSSHIYAEYLIHDSGGRPFKVVSTFNLDKQYHDIDVYRAIRENVVTEWAYEKSPLMQFCSRTVFVGCNRVHYDGKDGLLRYDDADERDERDQGNTILIRLDAEEAKDALDYVWIGNHGIQKFCTTAPITRFFSDIGCNDVPYAYAIDSEGTIHLLNEDVVVLAGGPMHALIKQNEFPQWAYYDAYHITTDVCLKAPVFSNRMKVREFWLRDPASLERLSERSTLNYHADAGKYWDSWLSKQYTNLQFEIEDDDGKDAHVVDVTREMYVALIVSFGEEHGLAHLGLNELVRRP